MSSPIVELLSSAVKIHQDQRDLFDQLMEKSFPTADEITQIADILRGTVERFNDYSTEMKERIEKLRTKTFFHIPYSINDALSRLAMISSASKVLAITGGSLAITGGFLAIFGLDIPGIKWTGIYLFAGAEALDVAASLYENKVQLASQEMSDLAAISARNKLDSLETNTEDFWSLRKPFSEDFENEEDTAISVRNELDSLETNTEDFWSLRKPFSEDFENEEDTAISARNELDSLETNTEDFWSLRKLFSEDFELETNTEDFWSLRKLFSEDFELETNTEDFWSLRKLFSEDSENEEDVS